MTTETGDPKDAPAQPRAHVSTVPFKGLAPYSDSEEDAKFFFSRDRERREVLDRVMATRLLLLYGPSGVGKSSLLHAGVVHTLCGIARANRQAGGAPELAVAVLDSWRDEPVTTLKERLAGALRTARPDQPLELPSPDLSLHEYLADAASLVEGELFIILDQFEEYFLYHVGEAGDDNFGPQFPRVLDDLSLPVSFLLSMREDSIAMLDHFKRAIPNLFANRYRLDYLDREGARAAIKGPLCAYNKQLRKHRSSVRVKREPALVERVLDGVTIGKVDFVETGQAGREGTGGRIATPYLQLVMRRLWDEETRMGSRHLRLATLEGLGGVEGIVQSHLDETLSVLSPAGQQVAASILGRLVTRSGTKYAYTVQDLAGPDATGLSVEQIAQVVRKLSRGDVRILSNIGPPPGAPPGGADRYQIFHDVLAPAVLAWRRRHLERQEKEAIRRQEQQRRNEDLAEQEHQWRKKRSRWLRNASAGVVILVLVLGAVFWANERRHQAVLDTLKSELRPRLDASLKALGFLPEADVNVRMPGHGATATERIQLRRAGTYGIAAICSANCSGLKFELYQGDHLVDTDLLPGEITMRFWPAQQEGQYRLTIAMDECTDDPCAYAYRLYLFSPEALVRSELDKLPRLPDYTPRDTIGSLGPGMTDSLPVLLERDTDYVVLGICDSNCQDLELRLRLGGQVLHRSVRVEGSTDLELPPNPTAVGQLLQFSVPEDGEYRLDIHMADCIANECYYGYRMNSPTREAALRTNLASFAAADPYLGPAEALLGAGADTTVFLPINQAGDYRISALCEDGCDSFHLQLFRGNSRITETREEEALQTLDFPVEQAGEYRLVVGMRECRRESCYVGYQVSRVPNP